MKIFSPKYQLIRSFCLGNIFEIVNMTNWAIPFLKKNVICLQFPLLSPLQSIVLNFNRRGILGGKFDNARIRNIILDLFWQNWESFDYKIWIDDTLLCISHTKSLPKMSCKYPICDYAFSRLCSDVHFVQNAQSNQL